eukprot:TCONS_00004952-protein
MKMRLKFIFCILILISICYGLNHKQKEDLEEFLNAMDSRYSPHDEVKEMYGKPGGNSYIDQKLTSLLGMYFNMRNKHQGEKSNDEGRRSRNPNGIGIWSDENRYRNPNGIGIWRDYESRRSPNGIGIWKDSEWRYPNGIGKRTPKRNPNGIGIWRDEEERRRDQNQIGIWSFGVKHRGGSNPSGIGVWDESADSKKKKGPVDRPGFDMWLRNFKKLVKRVLADEDK